jgi:hypothetical protein
MGGPGKEPDDPEPMKSDRVDQFIEKGVGPHLLRSCDVLVRVDRMTIEEEWNALGAKVALVPSVAGVNGKGVFDRLCYGHVCRTRIALK